MNDHEGLREIDSKVSRYVLDWEEKRKLLDKIRMRDLQQFMRGRGVFIFARRKRDVIDQMLMMSFSYTDMQELFKLAGEE